MKNVLILFLLTMLASCSTVPGAKEPTDKDINAEAAKEYAKVKKSSKLSKNTRLTKIVKRVADRIAKASGVKFDWEVILIESDQVNAWCMPGGKMAVYTGILPVLKNEAALAAVMGHEVAHATLRHGKKGYVRAIKQQWNSMLLGGALLLGGEAFCKTENCKKLARAGAVLGALGLEFYNRKYSRSDETDSDKVGQKYMAKAGYDPREASKVWQRLRKAGGSGGPELLSTHPASDRREKNLKAWAPSAMKLYSSSKVKYGLGEKL